MSGPYELRPLTPDVFPLLTPLMEDAFGDIVGPEQFAWKYLDNPAGQAIGNVAVHSETGEIAAFYGMIPEEYRWGSEVRRIYQSCDTMTSSRHRRKGLFKLLAMETYRFAQGADPEFFAFGFGGPTSTPGFVKMGWRIEFQVRPVFRPRLLNRLPTRGTARGEPLRELAEVEQPLLSLIAAREARRPNSKLLSEPFVRWRLSNPARDYRFVVDPDRAYAIFYPAGTHLFLFDFWEVEPGMGRRVMNAVRDRSRGQRGVVTLCQTGSDLERQLRRYWFLSNPLRRGPGSATTPFITYGELAGGSGADRWEITPFDHDSY